MFKKMFLWFVFLIVLIVIFDIFIVHNQYLLYAGFSRPDFFILYFFQTITIVFALFTRQIYLRYVYISILFILYTVFMSYELISHSAFNRYEALLAVDQFSFAGDAFAAYSSEIIKAMLSTSLFLGVIGFLVLKSKIRISSRYTFIPLILLSLLFVFSIRSGTVLKSFTAPYQVVFSMYYALSGKQYFGPRDAVDRTPTKGSKFDKIVLLMDESVRGDMLGVNGYKVNTTPFLKDHKELFTNYGIASSSANCSTASNLTVQSGLRSKSLPDKEQFSLKNANIFDYMNKAGYTTVFIDGQNPGEQPIHNMTTYDIKKINVYIQMMRLEHKIDFKTMDIEIANVIAMELKKYKKVFIYVNKAGTHFPYPAHYPEDQVVFTPSRTLISTTYDEIETKNSYYNALLWNVDKFFKKLIPLTQDESPLIMYTSDHGQNIFDHPTIRRSHCNGTPVVEEGNIPFIIFPLNKSHDIFEALKSDSPDNLNKLSHFEIFPTLIDFAGYTLHEDEYTIFDSVPSERFFYSGDMWGRTETSKHMFSFK